MRKGLCWNEPETWVDLMRGSLRKVDLEILSKNMYGRVCDPIWEKILIRMKSNFDGIVVYHASGCRIEELMKAGIRILSFDEKCKRAVDLFGREFSECQVLSACCEVLDGEMVPEKRNSCIYSCVDMNVLLRSNTHYFGYGGEYMQCVASRLGLRAEKVLESLGVPMLFEMFVGWDGITHECALGLCRDFYINIDNFDLRNGPGLDRTVEIDRSIPWNDIVRYWRPVARRNGSLGETHFEMGQALSPAT